MKEATAKIVALESVARAWTKEGVKWAVTNGLENYPAGVGRDLDVVVERGSLRRAVQIVIDCLGRNGWVVVPHKQGWIWWVVAFFEQADGSIVSLQIDLFEHLQWAFTRVVEGVGTDGPLIRRGPFFEDPGASVSKKFLLHALSSGAKAFQNKPAYLKMSEVELSTLFSILVRVSGCEWPDLVEAVTHRDLVQLDRELNPFRRACYQHALKSRGRWKRLLGAFQKQWVVNICPGKGAPVLKILVPPTPEGADVTKIVRTEMSSLVFQKVQIIGEQAALSGRDLRRLSCLQVVLIFENARLPTGLAVDLMICPQGNGFVIKLPKDEEGENPLEFSQKNLRHSLMSLFGNDSIRQFRRHQFISSKKKRAPN